jgi:hypothetical protein
MFSRGEDPKQCIRQTAESTAPAFSGYRRSPTRFQTKADAARRKPPPSSTCVRAREGRVGTEIRRATNQLRGTCEDGRLDLVGSRQALRSVQEELEFLIVVTDLGRVADRSRYAMLPSGSRAVGPRNPLTLAGSAESRLRDASVHRSSVYSCASTTRRAVEEDALRHLDVTRRLNHRSRGRCGQPAGQRQRTPSRLDVRTEDRCDAEVLAEAYDSPRRNHPGSAHSEPLLRARGLLQRVGDPRRVTGWGRRTPEATVSAGEGCRGVPTLTTPRRVSAHHVTSRIKPA